MDSSDFSALIGRLEREADSRPQLYLAKVAGAAALGYLAPALAMLVILAACVSGIRALGAGDTPSLWMVLAAICGTAALMATVRALQVRIAEADGLRISPEDAPKLFALIDRVSARMQVAALTSVTIDGELSLRIRQIPRWGVFGGYRNHLQVGVPLLIALSVDELAALLAHELGHLDWPGRRFPAWIYRQRQTCTLLPAKFAEPAHPFERLLAVFYRWYAPWFHAYSFALARNCEYEADGMAAAITDARTVADALIKQALVSRFLSEVFWARFLARVEETPEPPYRPYSLLPRALKVAERDPSRAEWLMESLRKYPAEGDTHPALAERLIALEVSAQLPDATSGHIALTLLGGAALRAIRYCDERWREQNLANWRKRHRQIQEARWKISQYEQHDDGALSVEDLWSKAGLLLTVNRELEASEALQTLLAREGVYPEAQLLLGQLLLAQSDERGLSHLLEAAGQNAELAGTAESVGHAYLASRGRKSEAQRFSQRIARLIGG